MPRKKVLLANNEIYHVVLRGTERINIFKNDSDYLRAICNLFEFNDRNLTSWAYRRKFGVQPRTIDIIDTDWQRETLVDILAFSLMPNHIHLLLQQVRDGGISKFMHKFGTGFAGYFNKKYERVGHLFQGNFRSIHIKNDNQLRCIFVYIHTNSAVLIDLNWKTGGIKNSREVIKFIENYRWSSYPDYLGKDNFSLVTQRDLFNQMMGKDEWRRFVNDWVKRKTFSGFGWDKSVELE